MGKFECRLKLDCLGHLSGNALATGSLLREWHFEQFILELLNSLVLHELLAFAVVFHIYSSQSVQNHWLLSGCLMRTGICLSGFKGRLLDGIPQILPNSSITHAQFHVLRRSQRL